MNEIIIDSPKPTLATLPAEVLHMILSDSAVPDIAQLYELRFVCRSVGAAAFRAFLKKINDLLVVRRDRSPAFVTAVAAIQRGRVKPDTRLSPFSLGCLLRTAGLPSDAAFVVPLLDNMYMRVSKRGKIGPFLRGLACPAHDAVDTVWSLFRTVASPSVGEIHEMLKEALPGPENTAGLVEALLASAFGDDDKFSLISMRHERIDGKALTCQAKFDLVLDEASRRFGSNDRGIIDMLARSEFLWKEETDAIGAAVAKTPLGGWTLGFHLLKRRHHVVKTERSELDYNRLVSSSVGYIIGLFSDPTIHEPQEFWESIYPCFYLLDPKGQDSLAALFLTRQRSEWAWPLVKWCNQLDHVGYDFLNAFCRIKDHENDEGLKDSFRAFADRVGLKHNTYLARGVGMMLANCAMGPSRDAEQLSFPRVRLLMDVLDEPAQVLGQCLSWNLSNQFGNRPDQRQCGRLIGNIPEDRLFPLLDGFFPTFGPAELSASLCALIKQCTPGGRRWSTDFTRTLARPLGSVLSWAVERAGIEGGRGYLFFMEYVEKLFAGLTADLGNDERAVYIPWLVGRFLGIQQVQHRTMLADALATPSVIALFDSKQAIRSFLAGYSGSARHWILDAFFTEDLAWDLAGQTEFMSSQTFRRFVAALTPGTSDGEHVEYDD